ITAVLEKADCGFMLDVNNVYVNSRNHKYDPFEFIRKLPLHRVAQIHVAGHKDNGDTLVDTHEGPIIDPVWKLYEFTIQQMERPVSTLIEWDTNVPPLKRVLEEAAIADRLMNWKPAGRAVEFHPLRDNLRVDRLPMGASYAVGA
ncbi:MAG: DUF692 family protein, partial [Elusimicrobia bacterium]|nr:DUF692 family protein [Elusimicrobiota bacterium]